MLLSKDQILAAQDLPSQDVDVPEWGGAVRVRALTGIERDKWESMCFADGKATLNENVRAKLLVFACIDDEGKPLFTESEIAALSGKNGAALGKLWSVAANLSGVLKNVETEVKN